MGEKIGSLIGYIIAFALAGFISWLMLTEISNEQQAQKAMMQQQIQQCVDAGGSVEVKKGLLGGWSCHIPNEVLIDE